MVITVRYSRTHARMHSLNVVAPHKPGRPSIDQTADGNHSSLLTHTRTHALTKRGSAAQTGKTVHRPNRRWLSEFVNYTLTHARTHSLNVVAPHKPGRPSIDQTADDNHSSLLTHTRTHSLNVVAPHKPGRPSIDQTADGYQSLLITLSRTHALTKRGSAAQTGKTVHRPNRRW